MSHDADMPAIPTLGQQSCSRCRTPCGWYQLIDTKTKRPVLETPLCLRCATAMNGNAAGEWKNEKWEAIR